MKELLFLFILLSICVAVTEYESVDGYFNRNEFVAVADDVKTPFD